MFSVLDLSRYIDYSDVVQGPYKGYLETSFLDKNDGQYLEAIKIITSIQETWFEIVRGAIFLKSVILLGFLYVGSYSEISFFTYLIL